MHVLKYYRIIKDINNNELGHDIVANSLSFEAFEERQLEHMTLGKL